MIIPYICRRYGYILLHSEPAYVCRRSCRLLFACNTGSAVGDGGLSAVAANSASAAMGWVTVLILGLLVLLTVVADYFIPALGVRWFGGTPYGRKGSVAGTLVGLFFMPWGLIAGPFLGAFVGELIGKTNVGGAFKSGVGSLVGFLCGTFFKVIVAIVITCYAIAAIV